MKLYRELEPGEGVEGAVLRSVWLRPVDASEIPELHTELVESLCNLEKELGRERNEAVARAEKAEAWAKTCESAHKKGAAMYGDVLQERDEWKEKAGEIERLKDTTDRWIARSEREPQPEDFEPTGKIQLSYNFGTNLKVVQMRMREVGNWNENYTHWRIVTLPQEYIVGDVCDKNEPPQEEKKFVEQDRWIARSEREPTPEDFEPTGDVLIWHKDGGIYVITPGETYDAYTHWRRVTPPQEEKNVEK